MANEIQTLYASVLSSKQDWRIDWKEDVKPDWKVDWPVVSAEGEAPLIVVEVSLNGGGFLGTSVDISYCEYTGTEPVVSEINWVIDGIGVDYENIGDSFFPTETDVGKVVYVTQTLTNDFGTVVSTSNAVTIAGAQYVHPTLGNRADPFAADLVVGFDCFAYGDTGFRGFNKHFVSPNLRSVGGEPHKALVGGPYAQYYIDAFQGVQNSSIGVPVSPPVEIGTGDFFLEAVLQIDPARENARVLFSLGASNPEIAAYFYPASEFTQDEIRIMFPMQSATAFAYYPTLAEKSTLIFLAYMRKNGVNYLAINGQWVDENSPDPVNYLGPISVLNVNDDTPPDGYGGPDICMGIRFTAAARETENVTFIPDFPAYRIAGAGWIWSANPNNTAESDGTYVSAPNAVIAEYARSSGKYYFELTKATFGDQGDGFLSGVASVTGFDGTLASLSSYWGFHSSTGGDLLTNTADTLGATSWATSPILAGDVVGFAVDIDAGTMIITVNGTALDTATLGLASTPLCPFASTVAAQNHFYTVALTADTQYYRPNGYSPWV